MNLHFLNFAESLTQPLISDKMLLWTALHGTTHECTLSEGCYNEVLTNFIIGYALVKDENQVRIKDLAWAIQESFQNTMQITAAHQ